MVEPNAFKNMTCMGWQSSTCCYCDNRALFPNHRAFSFRAHWQWCGFRGFLALLLTVKAELWQKIIGRRGSESCHECSEVTAMNDHENTIINKKRFHTNQNLVIIWKW